MRKLAGAAAVTLALSGAGVALASPASAGPFCDFFDVAGLCDVRDAIKACSDYPQACDQYSPPSAQPPQRPTSAQ